MIVNDSGYNVPLDYISHLITLGKVFFKSYSATFSGASVTHWKTGAKPVFMKYLIASNVRLSITMSEGAVCSADGTPAPVLNRNRLFPDDKMLFKRFSAPTVTSAGTTISTQAIGITASPKNNISDFLILAPNTSYIITLTPDSSTDVTVDFLIWEE